MKKAFQSILNVYKGILLIVIISFILLFTDRENRNKNGRLITSAQDSFKFSHKLNLCLIQYNEAPISEECRDGIIKGLKETGLAEGTDYDLKIVNAQGDLATLVNIIDEANSSGYDLIFATSTPTLQTIAKKITNTPIVFSVVADPVLAGAGTSFSDHQSNITGISTLGDYPGMAALLMKILPNAKTIGTLYTPGEANSVSNKEAMEKAAAKAGLVLVAVPVNSSAETMDAALLLCTKRIDAVCQVVDNLTSASFSSIQKACENSGMPLFGLVDDQAEKGAIAAVSRDYNQSGMDAVRLAMRILKGESPAGIPFEYVSKTNLIINLKSAALYKITIPDSLVKKADRIIE